MSLTLCGCAGGAAATTADNVIPQAMPSPSPLVYAAIGDSITQGYGLPDPAKQGFPALVSAALHASSMSAADVFGGLTVNIVANEIPLVPAGTNFVTFEVGTNDVWRIANPAYFNVDPVSYFASWKASYAAGIQALEKMGLKPSEIVLINVHNMAYFNAPGVPLKQSTTDAVNQIDAEINAYAARGFVVVDFRCDPILGNPALFQDGIHPTVSGDQELASLIVRTIQNPIAPLADCPEAH